MFFGCILHFSRVSPPFPLLLAFPCHFHASFSFSFSCLFVATLDVLIFGVKCRTLDLGDFVTFAIPSFELRAVGMGFGHRSHGFRLGFEEREVLTVGLGIGDRGEIVFWSRNIRMLGVGFPRHNATMQKMEDRIGDVTQTLEADGIVVVPVENRTVWSWPFYLLLSRFLLLALCPLSSFPNFTPPLPPETKLNAVLTYRLVLMTYNGIVLLLVGYQADEHILRQYQRLWIVSRSGIRRGAVDSESGESVYGFWFEFMVFFFALALFFVVFPRTDANGFFFTQAKMLCISHDAARAIRVLRDGLRLHRPHSFAQADTLARYP